MKWVSSFQAVKQLRNAGVQDPMALAVWAEKGLLRARAAAAKRDGEDDRLPNDNNIPSEFWSWVKNDEAHWEMGDFAASVNEEPEANHRGATHHWRLSGVTFHPGDLKERLRILESGPVSGPRKKRVSEPALNRWFEKSGLKEARTATIKSAAEQYFPDHSVPRAMIRKARGPRGSGRPKKRPQPDG